MSNEIPLVVELLYRSMVTEPDQRFWPEYLRNDPVRGHGLWSFYSGLKTGLQLGSACLEKD